jgi:hypothetical protein
MNASQPEKLAPPADRNRAPSAGDTANPDELKDDLENMNPSKSWGSDSSRRDGVTLRHRSPRSPEYRRDEGRIGR